MLSLTMKSGVFIINYVLNIIRLGLNKYNKRYKKLDAVNDSILDPVKIVKTGITIINVIHTYLFCTTQICSG